MKDIAQCYGCSLWFDLEALRAENGGYDFDENSRCPQCAARARYDEDGDYPLGFETKEECAA